MRYRRCSAILAFALLACPAAAKEQRCGWLVNPTPGNWWLIDRQGEWTIGAQGGFQAPGIDLIPDLTTRDWVVTNGSSYGYGCVCMSADADPKAHRLSRIYSAVQESLSACRRDPELGKPE
jgi:hypothetical protein